MTNSTTTRIARPLWTRRDTKIEDGVYVDDVVSYQVAENILTGVAYNFRGTSEVRPCGPVSIRYTYPEGQVTS